MNFEVRLDYTHFYPGEDIPTIASCLTGIDKNKLIECCIKIINRECYFKDPYDFITGFFSSENIILGNRAIKIYKKIKETDQTNHEHKWVIANTFCLLMLLEEILKLPISEEKKSIQQIEEDLFKSILITNSILNKKQASLPKYDETVTDIDEYFAKLSFANILTYDDFSNINLPKRLLSQFIKATIFFDYCKTNEKYSALLNLFVEKFNINNSKSYITGLLPIYKEIIDTSKDNYIPIILLNPSDPIYEKHKRFLNALTLNQDNTEFKPDFTFFRETPLLKLKENEYYIISAPFLFDKLYNSVFYNFNEINSKQKGDLKIKNFFQDFTTNFSEKHLFINIIERIYERRCCIKYTEEDFKRNGYTDGLPDYYVRNGNKIFLFESKDIKFNAEIKQSFDYNKIKKYVENKLLKKESGADTGIGQLINNIKLLANNTFPLDTNYKSSKIRIYPILVLNDPIYSLPGFNHILNGWFQKGIEENGLSDMQIYPLVVIDIDTLIFYQKALAEKKMNLENELLSYFKFIKSKKVIPDQNYIESLFNHQLSFSDFVSIKMKDKQYESEAALEYIQNYIAKS